jgi:hypothetical protein
VSCGVVECKMRKFQRDGIVVWEGEGPRTSLSRVAGVRWWVAKGTAKLCGATPDKARFVR